MLDQLEDRTRRLGDKDHAVLAGWDIVGQLHATYVALLAEARRYDSRMQDIGA